jgi:hypothetical protein
MTGFTSMRTALLTLRSPGRRKPYGASFGFPFSGSLVDDRSRISLLQAAEFWIGVRVSGNMEGMADK